MLFLLFWFFAIFSIASSSCPNGSIASFSDPTKCYFFKTQKLNWIAAEQNCKDLGGHLASIHSMFENVFLSGEASNLFTDSTVSDFWIGANRLFVPGNWTWSDGTPFDFDDFGKGQNSSNCGAEQLQNGNWIPANCMDNKPFSCLVNTQSLPATTTSKPTNCLDTWTYYSTTGYCYKVFDNANWLDAEDRCKIDGAHLTSIHSEDENLFVANLAYWPGADVCDGSKQAYIGLYRQDTSARFQWTDGTAYNYQNWANTEPYNGTAGLNCGYVDVAPICNEPTGRFRVTMIDVLLAKFICKKLAF